MSHYKYINAIALVGLTPTSIVATNDTVEIETKEGRSFRMWHEQDCCESVFIASTQGDLQSLVGVPILEVKEDIANKRPDDEPKYEYADDSETWTTFYLTNSKGTVRLRWCGTSNGYYSESVNFGETTERTP